MLKKLAVLLAIITIIIPMQVFALGLGTIEVNSALNQPLNARIPLLRVRQGELKDLSVKLAASETFTRAGIDRPAFLSQLKFSISSSRELGDFIEITSPQPITEPFMNFLLEVNWANGRLLREFTVLVDPPTMADGGFGGGGVSAPQAQELEVQEFEDTAGASVKANEGFLTEDMSVLDTVDPVTTTKSSVSTTTTEVVEPEFRQREVRVPSGSRPSSIAGTFSDLPSGGREYHTKRGDTLWEIAQEMKGNSGISVPQVMLALLEANPKAFYGNNINNLKMGHVLRLEDMGQATSLDPGDSARIADRQYQAWKANRGMMVGSSASSARVRSDAGSSDPSVRLMSPGEGRDDVFGSGGDGAALNEELTMANEQLDASKRESSELRERVSSLEDQVGTMERLIELKDDQLSTLQQQLGDAGVEPAVKPEDVESATAEVTAAQAAKEAAAAVEEAPAEAPAQPEVTAKAKPAPVVPPADVTAPAESGGIVDDVLGMLGGVGDMASGLLDTIMENIMYAGIGLLVLVLGIVGFVVYKRRSGGGSFQESIITGKSSLSDSSDISSGEDRSFMSDFEVSDMVALDGDMDEVDPLAEADVYLTYGRFKQAEELINTTMQASGATPELQIKMLEVLHAGKEKESFESKAAEYQPAVAANWDQVCAWATDLGCEDPIFSQSMAAPASDETMADIPDLPELDMGSSDSDTSALDDLGLDMDLDSFSADTGETAADDSGDGGMDFDLDSFSADTGEAAADESGGLDMGGEEAAADDGGLDFNMDMESAGEEAAADDAGLDFNMDMESAGEEAAADDGGLDFNMDMESGGEEAAADEGGLDFNMDMESAGEEAAADEGGLDFNMDMESAGEEAAADDAGMDFNMDMESAGEEATADDGGMDFNMDMDSGGEEAAADDGGLDFNMDMESAGEEATADDAGMDLNMDMDSAGEEAAVGDETISFDLEESAEDDATIAFNLEDEVTDEGVGAADNVVDFESASGGLAMDDEGGLDLDGDLGGDIDDSLFADVDEVGTKLDLAKAYIDMGDSDGAKSILDEVVEEGDDTQKEEARDLISQMA